MSEDYKKIALEDVKKGQRVRVTKYFASHDVSYTGAVYDINITQTTITIKLGNAIHRFQININPENVPDILLLEDVPKPKIVSVQTVLVTRYDDGTEKTEADPDGVWVPMRGNGWTEWVPAPTFIHTMEQFDAHEDYLKTMTLKDNDGYYWKHRNGEWLYGNSMELFGRVWAPSTSRGEISDSLPMTIVENVGD